MAELALDPQPEMRLQPFPCTRASSSATPPGEPPAAVSAFHVRREGSPHLSLSKTIKIRGSDLVSMNSALWTSTALARTSSCDPSHPSTALWARE